MPMLAQFHSQAGDCGYTIKQSLLLLDQAYRDPFQVVVGARTGDPSTGEGPFVAYIWGSVQENSAWLFQTWSSNREATKFLLDYFESWAKERGAFTIRAGVSRNWLKALDKIYGFKVVQSIVEKRLER